jgi:hypothetical protein
MTARKSASRVVVLLGSVLPRSCAPTSWGTTFPEVAFPSPTRGRHPLIGCVSGAARRPAAAARSTGVIFTRRALRWVDVIIACAVVATVLSAGVLIHMLSFVPGGGGPTIYFMVACIAGGLAFVLLMVVMRGLLESAIADRAELDEVI